MAWELGRGNRPHVLERRYQALVERVAAAQEPDGYLHTSFGRPGQPPRYSNLEAGHELYCFGHLFQAAVARLRTGHDDLLPQVARRLADHVYEKFGPRRPGGRLRPPGNRDGAGRVRPRDRGEALPGASPAVHRAARNRHPRPAPVRPGVLPGRHPGPRRRRPCAATRYAPSTSPRARSTWRPRPATASWPPRCSGNGRTGWRAAPTSPAGSARITRTRRSAMTSSCPADRAYAETCAGIASVMLSWRLLLATGEDKYADLIERTLLNNVLASPRADGRAFYYTNTLHQRTPGPVPDEQPARAIARSRGCARPGSRSRAARLTSRARWPASACTSPRRATTASSCTSTATTGCPPSWPRDRSPRRCPARYPGRRQGRGEHRRGARSGDHPPAAGAGLGVRHRRGERSADRAHRGPR